jgi:hypothetical protein
VFQIGTAAVIFFFAAPRSADAEMLAKRKFAGETKTSVDRRSQNRALD